MSVSRAESGGVLSTGPAQLVAYFDRISEAPDAIPRLRRFILDLAVRGKLVEQDSKDEPAAQLLRRIRAEKAELAKEKRIGFQKAAKADSSDELVFPLKPGWATARISEVVVELQTGPFGSSLHQSDYQKGGIPVINPASIRNDRLAPIDSMAVGPTTLERLAVFKLRAGDIVMARRGEMGRCAVVTEREDGWLCGTGSLILRLPKWVSARFLVMLLGSPIVRAYLGGSAVGTTMQNLNQGILLTLVVALPPLAEQQRIVAKVDELMALCDRLEAAQAERERRRNALVAASWRRLNERDEMPAVHVPASFHLRHLPRLATRVEHVRELRQAILNLAVGGSLVPQDLEDEPVTVVLAKSDRARQAVAEEDQRADADLQTLLAGQSKWSVPASWAWRALADLVLFIDYRGQTPRKIGSGVRLITAKNVKKGFINLSPEEFLSEESYLQWMTRGFPKADDVLFTTEAPMGNAAVVRLPERFALAQRVICFRPYGALNPDFLVLQLLAQPFQSILDATATGLTAKGIKGAKLKRLPVVVPPLSEQHRIVAKVDELMAVCDQLEAQLTTSQAESRHLLEAVLHQALANAHDLRQTAQAPVT